MDTNGAIAALLRDLAAVQTSQHSRWGYKRAAAAIRNLEAPIEQRRVVSGFSRTMNYVASGFSRTVTATTIAQ